MRLELARVLAFTGVHELSPSSYVELTSHGDRARTYRAIDQLWCARKCSTPSAIAIG